jgi:hypothetical protein
LLGRSLDAHESQVLVVKEIQQENDRDAYPRAAVQAAQSAITVCQLLEGHTRAKNLRVLEMRVLAGKSAIMFAEMAIFMLKDREEALMKQNRDSLKEWVSSARNEVCKLEELVSRQLEPQKPS